MAKIKVDLERIISDVDPKIFGHFTEHAFKNIYGGVYDPASPLSDEDGFRTDVLDLLKKAHVSILRYPGGNFVSNYHWEDGVGPKEDRRPKYEYAWHTSESNQFGTADFIKECRKTGAEAYITVNMGSGTAEEAMHWVEYCNGTGNTYYANLRREHGYPEPFNVKYWGLGNEVYGDWQMGSLTAKQYADKAVQFAKAMKWVDPSISLVACGKESDCDWNYTVMKELNSLVDYISVHHYSSIWGPFERNNYLQNLYIPDHIEKMTKMVRSCIIAGQNDTDGRIKLSWDEWNIVGWLGFDVDDDRSYTLQNALVTGLILHAFIRNSDVIGIANYSTFVNINGALSVKEDAVLCRPQYYVFELLAGNTGTKYVSTLVDCEKLTVPIPGNTYRRSPVIFETEALLNDAMYRDGKTALTDKISAAATTNDNGDLFLSVINGSPDEDIEIDIDIEGGDIAESGAEIYSIYNEDVWACNTLQDPDAVKTEKLPPISSGNQMRFLARKHSINLIKLRKA